MLAALQAASSVRAPPFLSRQCSHAGSLQLALRHMHRRRVRRARGCQSAAAAAILGEAAQLPSIVLAAQSLGDLLISAASGLALHSSTSPPLPPHVPLPGAWALLADLATALQPSCFDAECQREKDMLLEARCV